MLTPWGYSVEGTMPDLITRDEFDAATGGAYAADNRVPAAIAAASAAIRAHCGWHVSPQLSCTATIDGEAGDIWLPCAALTDVGSVKFDGEPQRVVGYSHRGRVRTECPQPRGLGNVTVAYTAGYSACATPDLMSVVVGRVLAYVALGSYGIAQETTDGVSISYSGSALSDAGGSYIPQSAAKALAPYRLVRAHAA